MEMEQNSVEFIHHRYHRFSQIAYGNSFINLYLGNTTVPTLAAISLRVSFNFC